MFTEHVLANIIRFYGQAMTGYMGPYLEKNIQAMTEMQGSTGRQGQGIDARNVGEFHGDADADAERADGQLCRTVEDGLSADAGPDAEERRSGAGGIRHQEAVAIIRCNETSAKLTSVTVAARSARPAPD